ncbi:MAG: hypothetical protein BMS9Abin05_1236 [Rhodothermia bacterium]|nr:MAG: hypothetical protein BMS9Abin05_1236 [Rhodothermia bacterium]
MSADSPAPAGQRLVPISEDEVIFSFLQSSTESLPAGILRRLNKVVDNNTFEEKLVCRKICQSIDRLEYIRARYWYRASLTSRQLEFVRLGQESSNNFSKFFSRGTYKPCVAADNIQSWSNLSAERKMHRDKVMRFSESIEVRELDRVILCASNFTVNRRLKVFDGNHRIIAYIVKYRTLIPFTCIVGFSKPLYFGLVQRALLAFPYFNEMEKAVKFAARNNVQRIRGLLAGGINYQPLFKDGHAIRKLSSSVNGQCDDLTHVRMESERLCVGRARILRDDMRSIIGELKGCTLLDIGCNVGFFCHFFASLEMRAVGIDNSQHNRCQRFSLSNSIRTARMLDRRYGLQCEFVEDDAREWVRHQTRHFDVTFLLSILHHFFIGYPVGDYEHDPMEEAKRFIEDIARITRRVLYIEYEDGESRVSANELIELLRSRELFRDIRIIDYSDDFRRPIIRCTKL